jgi:DNA polymerase-3 subunit alpha
VGEKAVESIVEARQARKDGARGQGGGDGRFRSLLDFCESVDLRLVNKSVIQCLVKAGAFDGLGVERARAFEGVGRAIDAGSRAQADRASGQASLFDALGGPPPGDGSDAGGGAEPAVKPDEGLPDVPEWPEKLRLAHEKSVMGIYVLGHPLSAFTKWLGVFSADSTMDVADSPDSRQVVIGGLLSAVQFRVARSSGNKWASVVLEDLHGTLECRVFARTLERVGEKLVPDSVALLAGRIDSAAGRTSLLVDEVIPISEAPSRLLGTVTIRVSPEDVEGDGLDELTLVLERHRGLAEVEFSVELPDGTEVVVRAGDEVKTAPGPDLESDLEDLLGPGCLSVRPARARFRLPESSGGNRWRERRRRA